MQQVSGRCTMCGSKWSGVASGKLLHPHVGFCCWLQWSEPVRKTEKLAYGVLAAARDAEKHGNHTRLLSLRRHLRMLVNILKDRNKP